MSEFKSDNIRCFNPRSGKSDGDYCVWEGGGKCLKCQAADEIDLLRQRIKAAEAEVARLKEQNEALELRVVALIGWTVEKDESIKATETEVAMYKAAFDTIDEQNTKLHQRTEAAEAKVAELHNMATDALISNDHLGQRVRALLLLEPS